eukprot:TRINITY_DN5103_c0_g1_i1.p1 TRINITY_DN5103_c0_g1~~TRINITY_DN5103_c0_g1_i1.p1  ORF type:complete len:215 (+),score=67.94 TRINITY_DN5103_c0_g1_i1:154-798(+)
MDELLIGGKGMKTAQEQDVLPEGLGKEQIAAVKHGFDALMSIVLEAAKNRAEIGSLTSLFIDELGFGEEDALVLAVLNQYRENVDLLRDALSTSSFNYPHLVDLDWRLDYFLKSNKIERVDEPVFLLKLKLSSDGSGLENNDLSAFSSLANADNAAQSGDADVLGSSDNKSLMVGNGGTITHDGQVQFTCTLDQLQDLVNALKDATKQVERNLQ